MKRVYYLLIEFLLSSIPVVAQVQSNSKYAFQPQEKITYHVYYNVIGIYVKAGTATLSTSTERMNSQDVYHVVAEGTTNRDYDWIFRVRDRYETYFTSAGLQPVKFVRSISEGNYKKHEEITFNRETSTATSNNGVYKVPENVQDVISVMYYARNINYNEYKAGDKIPFSMFMDDKVYYIYIHYIGKETVKTKYGKFNAIKLKPLLLKGNIFDGGEKMTIWITDDANHIPVRVESPIAVGSVKIDLMHYENLKYPLSVL
jgi:hypothetical protein